jgi:hypothetical protein
MPAYTGTEQRNPDFNDRREGESFKPELGAGIAEGFTIAY